MHIPISLILLLRLLYREIVFAIIHRKELVLSLMAQERHNRKRKLAINKEIRDFDKNERKRKKRN